MSDINTINLIPPDIIEEQTKSKKIKRGSSILLGLIICLLITGLFSYNHLKRMENEVSSIKNKRKEIENIQEKMVENNRYIEQLLKKRNDLYLLLRQSYFTPILYNLAYTIGPDLKLSSLAIKKNARTKRRAIPSASTKKPTSKLCHIKGCFKESIHTLSISEYEPAIKKTGLNIQKQKGARRFNICKDHYKKMKRAKKQDDKLLKPKFSAGPQKLPKREKIQKFLE